jgi:hypothetical protein
VALLEKRRYLNNRSGDFPQVILIVPSHVPNSNPFMNYKFTKAVTLQFFNIKDVIMMFAKSQNDEK